MDQPIRNYFGFLALWHVAALLLMAAIGWGLAHFLQLDFPTGASAVSILLPAMFVAQKQVDANGAYLTGAAAWSWALGAMLIMLSIDIFIAMAVILWGYDLALALPNPMMIVLVSLGVAGFMLVFIRFAHWLGGRSALKRLNAAK